MDFNKHFTQLDDDLRNLAAMDWATFAEMIGPEAILSAKICMLRSRGNSLQQIANRLEITKETARYWVDKQPERVKSKAK
jgi:hypothetical protein